MPADRKTSEEIRARLGELKVADLPRLSAAVRAMANLADALDQFDGSSRVAAEQIRNYLADALAVSAGRTRPADTGRPGCLSCTHMGGGVYCANDSTCPRRTARAHGEETLADPRPTESGSSDG